MNIIRKLATVALLALIAFSFSSCRTIAAEGTPQELQAVPASQMALLDSAMTSIKAGDDRWVGPNGNVRVDAILAVLKADREAWSQLDRFYNPDASAPTAPATE